MDPARLSAQVCWHGHRAPASLAQGRVVIASASPRSGASRFQAKKKAIQND